MYNLRKSRGGFKLAEKVYNLKYDTDFDKDINDWMESLPKSRKGELIRSAIRLWMNQDNEKTLIIPVGSKDPIKGDSDVDE